MVIEECLHDLNFPMQFGGDVRVCHICFFPPIVHEQYYPSIASHALLQSGFH